MCDKTNISIPLSQGAALPLVIVQPTDEMLTKEEVAGRLKVSVRTIENWQHDGHITFLKISNVILFYWPAVVKHFLTNYTVCPRAALKALVGEAKPWCGPVAAPLANEAVAARHALPNKGGAR